VPRFWLWLFVVFVGFSSLPTNQATATPSVDTRVDAFLKKGDLSAKAVKEFLCGLEGAAADSVILLFRNEIGDETLYGHFFLPAYLDCRGAVLFIGFPRLEGGEIPLAYDLLDPGFERTLDLKQVETLLWAEVSYLQESPDRDYLTTAILRVVPKQFHRFFERLNSALEQETGYRYNSVRAYLEEREPQVEIPGRLETEFSVFRQLHEQLLEGLRRLPATTDLEVVDFTRPLLRSMYDSRLIGPEDYKTLREIYRMQ